jgi:hypothetical protein
LPSSHKLEEGSRVEFVEHLSTQTFEVRDLPWWTCASRYDKLDGNVPSVTRQHAAESVVWATKQRNHRVRDNAASRIWRECCRLARARQHDLVVVRATHRDDTELPTFVVDGNDVPLPTRHNDHARSDVGRRGEIWRRGVSCGRGKETET